MSKQLTKILSTELIEAGGLEVGKIYPFVAAITSIISEDLDTLTFRLNDLISVTFRKTFGHESDVDLLKSRIFETAIFICAITENGKDLHAFCRGVIFGKHQSSQVH
jgi:hypothetical protein